MASLLCTLGCFLPKIAAGISNLLGGSMTETEATIKISVVSVILFMIAFVAFVSLIDLLNKALGAMGDIVYIASLLGITLFSAGTLSFLAVLGAVVYAVKKVMEAFRLGELVPIAAVVIAIGWVVFCIVCSGELPNLLSSFSFLTSALPASMPVPV